MSDPRLLWMTEEEIEEMDGKAPSAERGPLDTDQYISPSELINSLGAEETTLAAMEQQEPVEDDLSWFEALSHGIADAPTLRPITRPLSGIQERVTRAGSDLLGVDREDRLDPTTIPFSQDMIDLDSMDSVDRGLYLGGNLIGDSFATVAAIYAGAPAVLGRVFNAARGGMQIADDAASSFLRTRALERSTLQPREITLRRTGMNLARTAGGPSATVDAHSTLVQSGATYSSLGFLSRVGAEMLESALTKPKTFLALEASTAASAAGLGAMMQDTAESGGDARAAFAVGGVVGSIFNPASLYSLVKTGSLAGYQAAGDFFQNFRGRGERRMAGSILAAIAMKHDMSPEDLTKSIDDLFRRADDLDASARNALPEGTSPNISESGRNLPIGMTGNRVLVALQKAASRSSIHSRAEDTDNINTFLSHLVRVEEAARVSGDPADLAFAAQFRDEFFNQMVSSRVNNAQQRVRSIYQRVAPSGTNNTDLSELARVRAETSTEVADIMQSVLKTLRDGERQLYNDLVGEHAVSPDFMAPLRRALDRSLARGGAWDELDGKTRKALENFAEEGGSISQLMNLRTRLFAKGRAARSGDDPGTSVVYYDAARAVKDIIDSQDVPGIDIARAYSNQLNEAFTNSTIGRFIREDRRGQTRVDPDKLLDKLFNARDGRATINLGDLIDNAAFGDVVDAARGSPNASLALQEATEARRLYLDQDITFDELVESISGFNGEFGTAVMNNSEMHVRAAAARFTDADGNVNYNALSNFVRENEELLAEFPDVREALKDTESAAVYLRDLERTSKMMQSDNFRRGLVGGLLGVHNPTPVVRNLIRAGNSREQTLGRLARLARQAEEGQGVSSPVPGAMAGLKSTVLDAVLQESMTRGGVDWVKYRDTLMAVPSGKVKGLARGEKPLNLIDQLVRDDIMSVDEASRLREIANMGADVQRALDSDLELDSLFAEAGDGNINAMIETAVSVAGSAAGSAAFKSLGFNGGAGNIIIPSRTAALARRLTISDRQKRVHSLILEATSNASLFRELLEPYSAADTRGFPAAWRSLQAAGFLSGLEGLESIFTGEDRDAYMDYYEDLDMENFRDEVLSSDFFQQIEDNSGDNL